MRGIIELAKTPLGWGVALATVLLLVARDAALEILKSVISALFHWVGTSAIAGPRLRRKAIHRYRGTVAEQMRRIPIPFQLPVEIPMRDVYVPLQAADSPGAARLQTHVDLEHAVRASRRSLILGAPGSGKTLFLRFLLWRLCSHTGSGDVDLPVYVALEEIDRTNGSIVVKIQEAFAECRLANADDFVRRELGSERGRIVVLFDGLDEVPSYRRGAIARKVAEFSATYPFARFVATCRTEAYSGALDGAVDRVFYVQPFTDELVDRFLYAWPLMTDHRSTDRLILVLRDTPRLAALVQNPLLLTMLAYLYTSQYGEQVGLLPRSRLLFYQEATQLLLSKWQEWRNAHPLVEKQIVLRHLALSTHEDVHDRRIVSYLKVLGDLRSVLAEIGHDPAEASAYLQEIVEGSGLLMKLDAGENFQFAHLTLQEYFAAAALKDDPERLLKNYRSDRNAWREVVKLWCGFQHDSTATIRYIAEDDKLLALQCVSEAAQVDDHYALELIEELEVSFQGANIDDPIIGSFGLVASDSRPLGRQILRYLIELTSEPEHRERAVTALVASNRSEAAVVIAGLASTDNSFVRHLELMGNVALHALETRAREGDVRTLASLTAIATPWAAQALARILWDENAAVRRRAALGLSQLVALPAIESALSTMELPASSELQAFVLPTWVWGPFIRHLPPRQGQVLLFIMARCFALLDELPPEDVASASRSIDGRVAAANFLFTSNGTARPWKNVDLLRAWSRRFRTQSSGIALSSDDGKAALRRLRLTPDEGAVFAKQLALFVDKSESRIDPHDVADEIALRLAGSVEGGPTPTRLLSRSPAALRVSVVYRTLNERRWPPQPRDWRDVNVPRPALPGWHHRVGFAIVAALAFASFPLLVEAAMNGRGAARYIYVLMSVWLIGGLGYSLTVKYQEHGVQPWRTGLGALTVAAVSPWAAVKILRGRMRTIEISEILGGTTLKMRLHKVRTGFVVALVFGFTPAWVCGVVMQLIDSRESWTFLLRTGLLGALLAGTFAAWLNARRSSNPIQGLLIKGVEGAGGGSVHNPSSPRRRQRR